MRIYLVPNSFNRKLLFITRHTYSQGRIQDFGAHEQQTFYRPPIIFLCLCINLEKINPKVFLSYNFYVINIRKIATF